MANPRKQSSSYWQESRRPLSCLVFVSPWLVAYELGLVWMGPTAIRNGAEAWLRSALDLLGLGHPAWLPVLVMAILLAWHYVRGDTWQPRFGCLATMAVESLGWAFGLTTLAIMLEPWWTGGRMSLDGAAAGSAVPQLITYCGAGLYEELLFRLLLLPATVLLLHSAGLNRIASTVAAVVVTSLLFAAVHYQMAVPMENVRVYFLYGEPFSWNTFLFRWLAGMFFAGLFAARGFGITVATHAWYDILVAML
ncbi:MAG: hypothetical protein KatS3mg110_4243 [Pirellulaceae bacterium]|nr:MAG: hypothetical protein KatS3mg110_4243 [Pirellulaceae bacterium]